MDEGEQGIRIRALAALGVGLGHEGTILQTEPVADATVGDARGSCLPPGRVASI
jgi:hypothetical protein